MNKILLSCSAVLALFFSLSAHAADSFPLNGKYILEDNRCLVFLPVGSPLQIISDANGLTFESIIDCSNSSACTPGETAFQTLGAYAVGDSTVVGAEGTVIENGLYADNNNEFFSVETLTNDVAGGGPTMGTTIVLDLLSSGLVSVNYRGIPCTFKKFN